MRFSCRVWAMRGPMPLTNCRDVSRVSSTPEMLSADSESQGAVPWPQERTWDDNDLFPVLSTGAPQRPAFWHKEARMGLYFRIPGLPVLIVPRTPLRTRVSFPAPQLSYRTEWANRRL